MNNPVIDIKNLSKKYIIPSGKNASYGSFRDSISNWFKKHSGRDSEETNVFWALRNIDLQIDKGEVVGIVGKNGSGKSTLLKLISNIVEPTSGSVHVKGRISSLIEVGAGFHPELTGRENVYFNGAILGMTTREIDERLEDILKFSEIEDFFDVPVKFYSSGMYVRLAFSVAIHVDPDILIVDEVLSVGDIEFQQKCQNKIREFLDQGKTVLLVSHSLEAVEALCSRAILLEEGRLVLNGKPNEVVQKYTGNIMKEPGYFTDLRAKEGTQATKITSIEVLDAKGKRAKDIRFGSGLRLKIKLKRPNKLELENVRVDINILGATNKTWIASYTNAPNYTDIQSDSFEILIRKADLSPGIYKGNISLHTHKDDLQQWIPEAFMFEVVDPENLVITGATENIYHESLEIHGQE